MAIKLKQEILRQTSKFRLSNFFIVKSYVVLNFAYLILDKLNNF